MAPPPRQPPEPWDDVLGGREPELPLAADDDDGGFDGGFAGPASGEPDRAAGETRDEGAARRPAGERPRPGRVYRRSRSGPQPDVPERRGRGRGIGVVLFLMAVPVAAWIGYRARLGPGIAELSPELLDFGEVRSGAAGEALEVRVRNRGERPLKPAAPSLEGEAAGDFVVIQDGCAARPLEPGEGCALRLAFAPGGAGPRRARLVVASDAPNSPQTLPLLGVGVAGALAFEPRELDFGAQEIGSAGTPRELQVVSAGSAPVRLERVAFEGLGAGAADFVVAADGCRGRRLAAGERCSLRFAFSPTAEGTRSATLRIESDAGEAGTAPRLVGRGVRPRPSLRLEPSALVFTEVQVGTTSPPAELRLENDGSGPLHVAAVAGEPAGGLEVDAADCLGRAIEPGGGCRVTVAYRPSAEGSGEAVLVVRHDAEPGLHRVPVSAIGTAPRLFADPDRLAFGDVALRGEPARRELRLVSSGSAPLAVAGVEARGSDAAAFELDAAGCLAGAVPPGEACVVRVLFRPRREGPQRAEIAVRSSAGDARVAVNGIGIRSALAVDRERLDFGDVATDGEGASRTLTLTSGGRAPLAIARLRLAGGAARDFRLGNDRCSGASLPPGERCAVTVTARPSGPGLREARLVVDSSADEEGREIALQVNGTVRAAARLEVDPETVDMGAGTVGQRGPIVTVTLANPGSARLALGQPEIGGEHAGDFRIVPGSCDGAQLIAPGGRCTLGLRFVPTARGLRRAVLVIPHDGAGGATRVELAGEGLAAISGT